jgi:hypothetical protein
MRAREGWRQSCALTRAASPASLIPGARVRYLVCIHTYMCMLLIYALPSCTHACMCVCVSSWENVYGGLFVVAAESSLAR